MKRTTITQASVLTVETSRYPKCRLFKPADTTEQSVTKIMARLEELLYPKIPLTQEEASRKWPPEKGWAHSDFDNPALKNWSQVGTYWVRQNQGSHPGCITTDRQGAHARWRNAPDSYCCAGFPYFRPESMKRFHREMEMIKPILRCRNFGGGGDLVISLQRTLEGPIGHCWGIRTGETFYRLIRGEAVVVIPLTKAALRRALKAIESPVALEDAA